MKRLIYGGLVLALTCAANAGTLSKAEPAKAALDLKRLEQIKTVVEKAIQEKQIPGAVVLVARHAQIAYFEALGQAQLVPESLPMRKEMMFDLASVTKPVATATSIMKLCELGQLRLTDRVSVYVPEFSRFIISDSEKGDEARIWHLLTHTSGLPAYTNADSAARVLGRPCSTEALVKYIAALPKLNAPGEEYRYSCLGFITLAFIVQKVTGKNIHEYSHDNIFEPLGMRHTTFVPEQSLLANVVPTEVQNGMPWRGIVHDPLARLQSGISGNAGLFANAEDLAIYAQMLLNGGTDGAVRIISPVTVKRMTEITETKANAARGLGWVVKRGESWLGGDLLPDGGFGHTGYTGTSIWIDPSQDLFIIILTNRVHPVDKGNVDGLRSAIANIVASAIR